MSSDILIVDDEKDIRALIAGVLEDEGYITRQAVDAKTTLDQVRARAPSVVLLDIWLEGSSMDGMELLRTIKHLRPNTQVIMISGHGTIETAVKAMKYGAYEFIEKPFQSDRLVFLVERAIESVALRRENLELRSREGPPEDLIGSSNPIVQLSRTIERVAPTGSRVLITGPAGSGKEIVARLIHRNSKRSEAAFIAVSCASLAPERLHKFLFGDDRNTPSGGVFDQADGGTLLLDEVADMPLETQSRMIRMLQEQRFE
ncbi:MAG: sigma-54-dependent transcriptional regulator, partial [Acidimicrobiales bacterium]